MSWSPAQIPSLAGTTAVVTGSNSGIGLVTATELARHGARVVLACRKVDVAEQAAEAIRTADADADVRVAALDLASLESVAAFADAWSGPLDLLVNNAGVMMPRSWRATADGFELQFGTNHLGTSRSPGGCCRPCSPRRAAGRDGGLAGPPAGQRRRAARATRRRATSRSGPTATASWPTCCSAPSCSDAPSGTRRG